MHNCALSAVSAMGETAPAEPRPNKGLSQVDMALDILKKFASRTKTRIAWDAISGCLGHVGDAGFLSMSKAMST